MSILKKIAIVLSAPGVKGAIEATAPTQQVLVGPTILQGKGDLSTVASAAPAQNASGFVWEKKKKRLDQWLDRLVQASGSQPVFLLVLLSLLTWAFLGIPFGQSQDWAITISNAQAIFSYVFDSLLMRQQLSGYERLVRVSAVLRSRALSHRRMLREIARSNRYKTVAVCGAALLRRSEAHPPGIAFASRLPTENLVGRVSTVAAKVVGNVAAVGFFWIGIFVWLGFGASLQWSNTWQLYINSATSALMVLIFALLANIRERHSAYMERCLDQIFEVDCAVERTLRTLARDATPNPAVVVPGPKVSRVQRAVFYYADIVGTLAGVAILLVVLVVWLCLGPVMTFDSNWWLLIGTYAGLVGLNDGFVLRNVQARLSDYEDASFEAALLADANVFLDAGIPDPLEGELDCSVIQERHSLNYRISAAVGTVCAHELTVVLGVLLIIGLIIGSSAMRWTETGQLLCNVPPSVIESFFMMILITGHNIAEARRRADLRSIYVRRLRLLAYVDGLEAVQAN